MTRLALGQAECQRGGELFPPRRLTGRAGARFPGGPASAIMAIYSGGGAGYEAGSFPPNRTCLPLPRNHALGCLVSFLD
ncbi:hypothetical protein Srufu_044360 [Streptomyces libani subsp. rufus]|nr:hypothetical protein Srufu_044360 [Streptomyces libani subsp. rufus]